MVMFWVSMLWSVQCSYTRFQMPILASLRIQVPWYVLFCPCVRGLCNGPKTRWLLSTDTWSMYTNNSIQHTAGYSFHIFTVIIQMMVVFLVLVNQVAIKCSSHSLKHFRKRSCITRLMCPDTLNERNAFILKSSLLLAPINPRRWTQYVPLKSWETLTWPHNITSQKTIRQALLCFARTLHTYDVIHYPTLCTHLFYRNNFTCCFLELL